jgi:glycosyltransferase involved in cell wall biosynthesis
LTISDQHYAAGRIGPAGQAFARATRLAFNRQLHLHDRRSPLAEDPVGYTAPVRTSDVARRLRAPRGRSGTPVATHALAAQPRRVAVVTRGNDNFLGLIRQTLEEAAQLDVRFVDLAQEDEDVLAEAGGVRGFARELLSGGGRLTKLAHERFQPLFDWADVVLIEWCIPHAVLLNLVDPGSTRVAIRLHSYEVFSPWPHLIDFSRVDDLIFVSEHLRDFARDVIPALSEKSMPRTPVLPLNLELSPYQRPKTDDARFNLGLVGWRAAAKDPLWALELLRRVRAHDSRFRLHLVGTPFDDSVSVVTQRYGEQLWRELADLERVGAVVRVEQTDDVPTVLTDIGVILSTSVRESFHAGLVEGAASGALPVVRDWPYFAGRPTGARTIFPASWIVETPEEAAERILRHTNSAAQWRDAGREAADHAMATWDWEVTRGAYLDLFAG